MKKFIDSISPKYEEIETDIDFSILTPYEMNSSLHILEYKYEINGQKYRTIKAINSDDYIVEIYINN